MEYGVFITGLYTGGARRKPKFNLQGQIVKENDGYDTTVTNGCGKFWKIKTEDDPTAICKFGDVVTLRIDNITAYKDNCYFSGAIVPGMPG